jgi:hypothetical protein
MLEFAIVGHPNEGKSAVVSTLSEDDSVRVSPFPGETTRCQTFPVVIDGKEIIRFTDTPGFQNPTQVLAWMKNFQGPDTLLLETFRQTHADNPDFKHDRELLGPLSRGAGIIYVVDGSRPLRKVDLAEMEILRLTGRPRMAIINPKEDETGYLEQWKNEFRKYFNAIRMFNAHKATYAERIELLENLKSIDQDWTPALETVISAFKKDWERRNDLTTDIICDMLSQCLGHSVSQHISENRDEETAIRQVQEHFARDIARMEKASHDNIRKLFKHNIFSYDLPAHSILREDLFSEKTWQVLGLTPTQLVIAAGLTGGAVGAAIDLAAAGLTFGIFLTLGGLLGAGWAALGGGKSLAKIRVAERMNLGGQQIRIGPIQNIQLLYVLLDRALIYYSHAINWAHGRRDYPSQDPGTRESGKAGLTTDWDETTKTTCHAFFTAIRNNEDYGKDVTRKALKAILKEVLQKISSSERRYGLVMSSLTRPPKL